MQILLIERIKRLFQLQWSVLKYATIGLMHSNYSYYHLLANAQSTQYYTVLQKTNPQLHICMSATVQDAHWAPQLRMVASKYKCSHEVVHIKQYNATRSQCLVHICYWHCSRISTTCQPDMYSCLIQETSKSHLCV